MKDKLVSVIIPTYNRPKFLKRAVESVLNQNYKNIEIIIVSDNDMDSEYEQETISIVNSLSKQGNITYLPAIGNRGGCYARNRGLKYANGEYVNFLDDDDTMLPQKIQLQINALEKNGEQTAVVGCYAAIKNSKGKIYRIEKPKYDSGDILFSELKCNLCTTSINLINTKICRKAGGFHYIESSQEHLFLIGVFTVDPTFCYVNQVLVEINQHEGPRVSNNSNRPIGTLKLTKYIEENYYKLYDEKHVKVLRLARLKADIMAYCILGEFCKAWELYKLRCKIKLLDIENFKIFIKMIQYTVLHKNKKY